MPKRKTQLYLQKAKVESTIAIAVRGYWLL
jgi:hypothetical protein